MESTTNDTRRTKHHEQATIELDVLLFLAVACAEPVTHRITAVATCFGSDYMVAYDRGVGSGRVMGVSKHPLS